MLRFNQTIRLFSMIILKGYKLVKVTIKVVHQTHSKFLIYASFFTNNITAKYTTVRICRPHSKTFQKAVTCSDASLDKTLLFSCSWQGILQ